MQLLIAVAQDLFSFAVDALFKRSAHPVAAGAHSADVVYLHGPAPVIALPPLAKESRIPFADNARAEAPQGVYEAPEANAGSAELFPRKNTVMYVASIDVPLRIRPETQAEVLLSLSYGTMLMVLESLGGWLRVISGSREGWILADDVADRAAHVYPQFVIGEENLADDPNTIRLRAMIGDAFGAGNGDLPLRSEEYVLYKLYRRARAPKVPRVSIYEAGRWGTILREFPHASVSAEPKAGAIMQVHFPEDVSLEHFAYVEAVFPDDSIQVSEANWPEEGIYNERVLVKEEWHALNPIFFIIT